MNLKFFNILFSLFASLDLYVFRMLLVGIDSQFFAFDNLEYVSLDFQCVGASKKCLAERVNKNPFKSIENSELT